MFIVTQDKEVVVNANNLTNIYISNGNIMARMVDSEVVVLGAYVGRAKEILAKMLDDIFIPNMVVTNKTIPDDFAEQFKGLENKPWGIAVSDGANAVPYSREVYYMPEE